MPETSGDGGSWSSPTCVCGPHRLQGWQGPQCRPSHHRRRVVPGQRSFRPSAHRRARNAREWRAPRWSGPPTCDRPQTSCTDSPGHAERPKPSAELMATGIDRVLCSPPRALRGRRTGRRGCGAPSMLPGTFARRSRARDRTTLPRTAALLAAEKGSCRRHWSGAALLGVPQQPSARSHAGCSPSRSTGRMHPGSDRHIGRRAQDLEQQLPAAFAKRPLRPY